jgi:hypothetical protein
MINISCPSALTSHGLIASKKSETNNSTAPHLIHLILISLRPFIFEHSFDFVANCSLSETLTLNPVKHCRRFYGVHTLVIPANDAGDIGFEFSAEAVVSPLSWKRKKR